MNDQKEIIHYHQLINNHRKHLDNHDPIYQEERKKHTLEVLKIVITLPPFEILMPFWVGSWALKIWLMLFVSKKFWMALSPKQIAPGPRSPSPKPDLSNHFSCWLGAGSDHNRSLANCLIYWLINSFNNQDTMTDFRSPFTLFTEQGQGMLLMLSKAVSLGESGRGIPPWTQKITSSIVAAKGK